MTDRICPFSATLARDAFACTQAESVIRRGGTEFACRSPESHDRCRAVFGQLKAAALAAFDVDDDLTRMPHSVLVKIQFGGLLGLARLTPGQPTGTDRVGNIDDLVTAAVTHFGSPLAIPANELAGDMTGYSLARRRRR
jgi:hypothetical protein